MGCDGPIPLAWPEPCDQINPLIGHPIPIRIPKRGHIRRMHNKQRIANEGEPLRRIEMIGEDCDAIRTAIAGRIVQTSLPGR